MDPVTRLATLVVAGFGLFLLGLAGTVVVMPPRAERFLLSFANTARAHYTEQALRLLVGLALVASASSLRFPGLFTLFGWIMVATTLVLLLMPWHWHHHFAGRVMPPVIRQMRVLALGAFALGVFVLYSLLPTIPAW